MSTQSTTSVTGSDRGYQTILFEKKDRIATVTMNRPRVMNAMNPTVIEELRAAFTEVRRDPGIRGAILTGAGDKSFAAGADLSTTAEQTALEAQEFMRAGKALLMMIEALGKPVIAAVNGYALGGGLEIAMACTFRIAAEEAHFGQPEVRWGIMPGWGGTQRLARLVGPGRALQMILTGAFVDAQEACRIGLVNEVVPRSELLARTEKILAQIAANAPLAVEYSIEAVLEGLDVPLADGLALESALNAVCMASEDRKEGATAFLEKRAPRFQGR
ncbi:MAG TPA: enoyl-CoA hydratase-related protein [Polyangiaceae bacterium]|nr:enoyl-CoA hydratase-related protein [Polyangiaceae bacterium]